MESLYQELKISIYYRGLGNLQESAGNEKVKALSNLVKKDFLLVDDTSKQSNYWYNKKW